MTVRVYIPTPYRQFTAKATHVEASAASVAELLQALAASYPGLGERILGPDGAMPGHLNIYINQVEARTLQGDATPLADGDEVALIPAMAGGAGDGAPVRAAPASGGARSAAAPEAPVAPAARNAAAPVAAALAPAPALAPAAAPSVPAAAPDRRPILTREQLERYSRHIRLDEVGLAGQKKLLDSKVLIIGAGALGSGAAIYLAAAGVGTIGIVDGDRVDLSNLHRQVLHFTHDVGRPKVESARRHLEDINPGVRVVAHASWLTSENALGIIADYDLVVNGSDNFPTRYLVNDACVLLGKPLVDASILKWDGQATVFLPGRGCYRCLFPAPPPPGSVPSCAEGGIIGALAGHMSTLEAIEAIKVLLGVGDPLAGRLVLYDALAGEYQQLRWRRNPECPVCGDHPTIHELIDYEGFCGVPGPEADGEHAGGSADGAGGEGGAFELSPGEAYDRTQHGALLIDVREPYEYGSVRIPGAELAPIGSLARAREHMDPDQEMIFVCRIGERSALAVDLLRRAGFHKTYNLAGGLVGWLNERLPVEEVGER